MGKRKEVSMDEFPVTVDEFASSIPRPESRRAFVQLMKSEEETGKKQRGEWQELFDAFMEQPSSMTWKEYREGK